MEIRHITCSDKAHRYERYALKTINKGLFFFEHTYILISLEIPLAQSDKSNAYVLP